MATWLVTGGSGFIGRHVLTALSARTEVVALGRSCPSGWPSDAFVTADLERTAEVIAALHAVQPDFVIHAAGRTPPASADELYRANTLATLHLLDACRDARPSARVVLTGSAAELGPVDEAALPVGEDHPCRPVDAYGRSKWLATCAGIAPGGLEVMVARVFNPVGPGQPKTQALGRFADELARGATSLVVGDLEARRDFVDVRDVARALMILAERGKAGQVYHLGTGRSHRVGDALDHFVRKSGRTVEIRVDPRWSAPGGPRDSRAEIGAIVEATGWRPRIGWEQSLDDLWNDVARSRRVSAPELVLGGPGSCRALRKARQEPGPPDIKDDTSQAQASG